MRVSDARQHCQEPEGERADQVQQPAQDAGEPLFVRLDRAGRASRKSCCFTVLRLCKFLAPK